MIRILLVRTLAVTAGGASIAPDANSGDRQGTRSVSLEQYLGALGLPAKLLAMRSSASRRSWVDNG